MPTFNQLCRKGRLLKLHKTRVKSLQQCPYKRGVCLKVFTVKPKKPNSAIRKVAKVMLSTKRRIIIAIPGIGHKLQEHAVVLVRGGRANDLPGVHYKAVRGKLDFTSYEHFERKNKRSKYGVAKTKFKA